MSAKIKTVITENFTATVDGSELKIKATTPTGKGLYRLKKFNNPQVLAYSGVAALLQDLESLEAKAAKLAAI